MFVFDLETYNNQGIAESYAGELYDVNRLGDKWNRGLSSDELQTERENVTVFDGSNGNPVMNMLKFISEN